MSTKHAQGISRRSFLAGTALASTGAVLGLAGCAPKENKGAEEANAETGSTSSDWLGSEPTVQESDIVETIDTEFLIVGAGTGGLFAACAAGEEGIETFVLEKYNGGVVRDDVGGVNSRLQQESGYTMDLQEYLLDMNHYAAGQCNLNLHKTWYEKSGETIDWYETVLDQYGVKLWHEAAEEKHETNYKHWATGHSPAWPEDGSLNGFTVLSDYAEKTGHVTFRYNTPMVKLVVEGDKVVGAIGKGENGYIQVNASKGVLVSTGGYGINVDMQKALQPHTTSLYGFNSAQPGCEGDGIKACPWAGAKMDDTHSSMLFDRGGLPADSLGGADCGVGTLFWKPALAQGEPERRALLQRIRHVRLRAALRRPAAGFHPRHALGCRFRHLRRAIRHARMLAPLPLRQRRRAEHPHPDGYGYERRAGGQGLHPKSRHLGRAGREARVARRRAHRHGGAQ